MLLKKNLFEYMPTSQSENIATSVLAYLIEQEEPDHKKVLEILGIKGVVKKVVLEHQFNRERRIDLIIETNTHLYGVEVKLGAHFSENQLEDYADLLKSESKSKGKEHELIALVPKWLLGEVAKCATAVDWSKILKVLNENHDVSKHFSDFVGPRLKELGSLDTKYENEKISGQQKTFLDRFIMHYFPGSDPLSSGRIGQSDSHYGCYVSNVDFSNKTKEVAYVSVQNVGKQTVGLVVLIHECLNLNLDLEQRPKDITEERNEQFKSRAWQRYERGSLGNAYKAWHITVEQKEDWEIVGECLVSLFKKISRVNE